MNEELELLKVASDPKDSRMLIYYQFGSLHVQKTKPKKLIKRIRKEIRGIIETERFLKGDPVAKPAREIVECSDVSFWLFEDGGLDEEAGEEYRAEYLKDMPQDRERLSSLIQAIESLEINYEAGLYDDGLEELKKYLFETGIAEEMRR